VEKIVARPVRADGGARGGTGVRAGAARGARLIFAKASLAREWKCSPPAVNDQGRIRLRKARHPLIASDRVVPVDVELGYAYTAIIITGPNTGGKTVTLKTIGLLHLMAMSGLFVPAAEESELCVFDGIYADIGDEQSIEQSLSTFSGHLTNIIRILREMTPNSLVLLDELGAGTDPAEGSALAIALLEHIHRKGCRVVATTHYSELKAYAYEREGVINASMEFDVQTLSPTYRLMVGVPGRSNAFAIAERLGLPREIIEQAQARVGAADRKVDHMIASLEENRIAAEEERLSAEKVRAEAEALRASLAEERRRFEEQKDRLLEKARQEARQMVERARREADAVIAELRQLAMQEQASIKEHKLIEAKRRLEEARARRQTRRGSPQTKPGPTGRTGRRSDRRRIRQEGDRTGRFRRRSDRADRHHEDESAAQPIGGYRAAAFGDARVPRLRLRYAHPRRCGAHGNRRARLFAGRRARRHRPVFG
jgi:Mismatch repair ATPase (MutS family)